MAMGPGFRFHDETNTGVGDLATRNVIKRFYNCIIEKNYTTDDATMGNICSFVDDKCAVGAIEQGIEPQPGSGESHHYEHIIISEQKKDPVCRNDSRMSAVCSRESYPIKK
jgi:hypothetical protein